MSFLKHLRDDNHEALFWSRCCEGSNPIAVVGPRLGAFLPHPARYTEPYKKHVPASGAQAGNVSVGDATYAALSKDRGKTTIYRTSYPNQTVMLTSRYSVSWKSYWVNTALTDIRWLNGFDPHRGVRGLLNSVTIETCVITLSESFKGEWRQTLNCAHMGMQIKVILAAVCSPFFLSRQCFCFFFYFKTLRAICLQAV